MGFLDVLNKPKQAAPVVPPAPRGGDPLDAAMEAAGVDVPAVPAAVPAGRGDSGDALAQQPTGEALIAFVESWVPLVVRGYAQVQGREWDREMDAACRLSITEKANLRLTADAAAPYVARLIAHSEKLAALGFVVQLGFVVAGKFALVKSKPLTRKPAEKVEAENGAEAEAPATAQRGAPVHRRPVGRPKGK